MKLKTRPISKKEGEMLRWEKIKNKKIKIKFSIV